MSIVAGDGPKLAPPIPAVLSAAASAARVPEDLDAIASVRETIERMTEALALLLENAPVHREVVGAVGAETADFCGYCHAEGDRHANACPWRLARSIMQGYQTPYGFACFEAGFRYVERRPISCFDATDEDVRAAYDRWINGEDA